VRVRDELLEKLQYSGQGLTTASLVETVGLDGGAEAAAIVDALLLLSPEAHLSGECWVASAATKGARVLRALRRHADDSERKLFRLSNALEGLEAHEHPTAEELGEMLAGSDEFELLPNSMIKRKND